MYMRLYTCLQSCGHNIFRKEKCPMRDPLSIAAEAKKLPWKIVFHDNPDTDAYACIWAAQRFVVPGGDECMFESVPAGESLPPDEREGYNVLTVDTGGGSDDQHGKELEGSSSFKLFLENHRLANDPGFSLISDLTVMADNVKKMDLTSVHYVLRGLRHRFTNRATGETDWESAFTIAFAMFDILYSQTHMRLHSRRLWEKFGGADKFETLPNGLKIANVMFQPNLREEAFNAGADVVLWFGRPADEKLKDRFYPAIQVHRDLPLKLYRVIESIRRAEADKRGIDLRGRQKELCAFGTNHSFGNWFFHDSGRFIGCGTRSHELIDSNGGDAFTTLSPTRIYKTVVDSLKTIACPPARKSTRE